MTVLPHEKWEIIRKSVLVGVSCIVDNENELLRHGLFEPCVSHRLGLHLQHEFSPLHVDCEYDRMLTKAGDAPARWDLKGLDKKRLSNDILALAKALEKPSANSIDLFIGRRRKLSYYFEKADEQLSLLKSPRKFARPDVIVHERDTDRNNLLVIEIKLGAADKCRVPMDLAKLVEFTTQPKLHYAFGLFLTFRAQSPYLQSALLFIDGYGFQLRPTDLRFESADAWYQHQP